MNTIILKCLAVAFLIGLATCIVSDLYKFPYLGITGVLLIGVSFTIGVVILNMERKQTKS